MRAARYLNWRINRRVSLEDKALIERVQAGMGSRSYTPGPLGHNEVSLRSFARRLREVIPESRLQHAPSPGWRTAAQSGGESRG
jgi:phenylpropionate dioxygenase-like ring-hydroxylating dioxygenase large terminal subunit